MIFIRTYDKINHKWSDRIPFLGVESIEVTLDEPNTNQVYVFEYPQEEANHKHNLGANLFGQDGTTRKREVTYPDVAPFNGKSEDGEEDDEEEEDDE